MGSESLVLAVPAPEELRNTDSPEPAVYADSRLEMLCTGEGCGGAICGAAVVGAGVIGDGTAPRPTGLLAMDIGGAAPGEGPLFAIGVGGRGDPGGGRGELGRGAPRPVGEEKASGLTGGSGLSRLVEAFDVCDGDRSAPLCDVAGELGLARFFGGGSGGTSFAGAIGDSVDVG